MPAPDEPARMTHRRQIEVVVLGSRDSARRLWEALTLGGADVLAFVDPDARRSGRPLLGTTVQPPSWLAAARFDLLAVPEADLPDAAVRSLLETVDRTRVLSLPADDAGALARAVSTRMPDPWADPGGDPLPGTGLHVGIFGTGSAAMKVGMALAEIDGAEPVWFADNNPGQQGRQLLWLNVITPAEIPAHAADVIVVGSMSRDAIHGQLVALGVPSARILTPDVAATVDCIRMDLRQALEGFARDEVPQ